MGLEWGPYASSLLVERREHRLRVELEVRALYQEHRSRHPSVYWRAATRLIRQHNASVGKASLAYIDKARAYGIKRRVLGRGIRSADDPRQLSLLA